MQGSVQPQNSEKSIISGFNCQSRSEIGSCPLFASVVFNYSILERKPGKSRREVASLYMKDNLKININIPHQRILKNIYKI